MTTEKVRIEYWSQHGKSDEVIKTNSLHIDITKYKGDTDLTEKYVHVMITKEGVLKVEVWGGEYSDCIHKWSDEEDV